MAVSQELLDILVCPLCKFPVKLIDIRNWNWKPEATIKDQQETRPYEQGLKCGQCRRVYPIKDDIPVMLVDEAKIEAE
jgi:uncharacterized protein YbaR (Trm112 family)